MTTSAQYDALYAELGRPPSPQELTLRYEPQRYGAIADLVDLAMANHSRPCTGDGCDLDDPCPRHLRSGVIAKRAARLLPRWRHLCWPHEFTGGRSTKEELRVRGYINRRPAAKPLSQRSGVHEIVSTRTGRVVARLTAIECNKWLKRLDRKMVRLAWGKRPAGNGLEAK